MQYIKNLPKIKELYITEITTSINLLDIAETFSKEHGTTLYLSGTNLDCARFNILGIYPWLEIRTKAKKIQIKQKNVTTSFKADPFEVLKNILCYFKIESIRYNLAYPFLYGLLGYFSYDLKDQIERLPSYSIDDLNLPDILLFCHRYVFVEDIKNKKTHLIIPLFENKNNQKADEINFILDKIASYNKNSNNFYTDGRLISNFEKKEYIDAIEKIKEYIVRGHVYQVNMSQRFICSFSGDEFSLFKKLFEINPAPFFAYIKTSDHTIVSTSPERFLYQNGPYVETRPIKGTRPRGKTKEEDEKLLNELKSSKKDDAELSMIVDLLRNDIGKVCKAGTVKVKEHKRVEKYHNVFHLISIVTGELKDNADSIDLIEATFPGGSITGCPKIRAMEIIEELEPNKRHIYTGSIGYISFHNTMDLSIAIRTATIINNTIIFSVGGGIVYDSDPLLEYEETLHKGQTFIHTLQKKSSPSKHKNKKIKYIYLNGKFLSTKDGYIPIDSLAFQYGLGLFETIRINNGYIYFLDEHISRLKKSWEELIPIPLPHLSWDLIISELLEKNKIKDKLVAAKIIAGMGKQTLPPYDPVIAIMVREYVPRLINKDRSGLKVGIYPEKRFIPLAKHKSLNYLYYLLAAKWSKRHGFDEAIILNPDGSISEGNSTNIILIKEDKVLLPESKYFLQGIMQSKILNFLKEKSYQIITKKIFPDELFKVDEVILSNSLIGGLRVESINNVKLNYSKSNIWEEINYHFFGSKF